MSQCLEGALDVDELIEALEQVGARPKRYEVTCLVRELNKGEDEMDRDVFEMLMTTAYSTANRDSDQKNILTSGTELSFSDIAQILKRKKLLEDVSLGGQKRKGIIQESAERLSEIDNQRKEKEVHHLPTCPQRSFSATKHQLLGAWRSTQGYPAYINFVRCQIPPAVSTFQGTEEWMSIIPMVPYELKAKV